MLPFVCLAILSEITNHAGRGWRYMIPALLVIHLREFFSHFFGDLLNKVTRHFVASNIQLKTINYARASILWLSFFKVMSLKGNLNGKLTLPEPNIN